jgi:hypothetical protein
LVASPLIKYACHIPAKQTPPMQHASGLHTRPSITDLLKLA